MRRRAPAQKLHLSRVLRQLSKLRSEIRASLEVYSKFGCPLAPQELRPAELNHNRRTTTVDAWALFEFRAADRLFQLGRNPCSRLRCWRFRFCRLSGLECDTSGLQVPVRRVEQVSVVLTNREARHGVWQACCQPTPFDARMHAICRKCCRNETCDIELK